MTLANHDTNGLGGNKAYEEISFMNEINSGETIYEKRDEILA